MARTPRTTAPQDIGDIVDPAAINSASTALATVSAQAQQLQATFGLESLDPAVLTIEIGGLIQQTGRALFAMGGRLCALRVVLPADDWKARLDQLGIAPRSASRLMSSALKCVDSTGEARERLMGLPQSKVLELVTLDEDKLDELEKTGAIGQLALEYDEIDKMSASELRRRVRELQSSNDAKDRVIQKKGKEIDRLHEAAEQTPTADDEAERTAAIVASLRDAATQAEASLTQLVAATRAAMDGAGAQEHISTAAQHGVEYVAQLFADLLRRHELPVQFEEIVTPEWLAETTTPKRGRKG